MDSIGSKVRHLGSGRRRLPLATFNPAAVLFRVSPSQVEQFLGAAGTTPFAGRWRTIKEIRRFLEELPPEVRDELSYWARCLYDLRGHHGQAAIAKAVATKLPARQLEFEAIESPDDRAAWLSVHDKKAFERAAIDSTIDSLRCKSSWRIRLDMPVEEFRVDLYTEEALKKELAAYYRSKQSRGAACVVDYFAQGHDEHIYTVYLADYPKSMPVFEGPQGGMKFRSIRPGFQNIFLLNTRERSLAIHSTGGSAVWMDLQVLFAKAVLGTDIDPVDHERPTFFLQHIVDPGFTLRTEVTDGIQSVGVSRIRLARVDRDLDQDIHIGENLRGNLPDVLASCFADRGLNPGLVTVRSVDLQFCFLIDGSLSTSTVTLRPKGSHGLLDLPDCPRDAIKACLRRWGIQRDS